ncbi:hypothetical protein [Laceyella tengchongensis]|uniref:hypothetical protein n=1 Tax=Laceyella tengchongensis TaxID=574699 RepID=UPI0012B7A80A|nr:hypothetical protein [Laceyella tengchongensis]
MKLSLTNNKIYRKLLSALFTWILFLLGYSYVIIESTTSEFLFFLAIASFFSFIGIFGYGLMVSIFFDFITKKIKGVTRYIVKFILYVISGLIGSAIISIGQNDLEQFYIFTTIIAIVYFLIDELNAMFINKN